MNWLMNEQQHIKPTSVWKSLTSTFESTNSTVDSRYLEFQGTLWNTSRYPYIDISDLQNWGKN